MSEGSGFFNFNGTQAVLKAGSCVFLRKSFPVDYGRVDGEFKTSWVTFDGEGVNGIFDYFNVGDYAILNEKSIENKIWEIYKLSEKSVASEVLSQKVYEIITEYFSLLKKQNGPPALKKAKDYIQQNYHRDLSVEEIADSAGVSQSLLFKIFREEEKTTPVEYLRQERIAKAEQMLLIGEMKIYEIASACGFSDVAYFCKVFKDYLGISPAVYRKKFLS